MIPGKALALLPLLTLLTAANISEESHGLDFDRTRGGLLVVILSVDGREGNFIVDTGAEITLVDARMLFLSRFGAGRPDTRARGGPSFSVQEATLCLCSGPRRAYFRMPVAVANLSGLESATGRKIDGLLGMDFFRHFQRVSIDFPSERLVLQ